MLASEQLGTLQQPESAEADAIRGFIAFRQWRWLEAERYFQKSIDSQANIANTHVWYSQFFSAVGKPEEALAEAQLAYELDPVSPVVNDRLAVTRLWLNQDEEAERLFVAGASLGFLNSINPGYLILLVRNRDIPGLQETLRDLHADGELDPVIERISAMFDITGREEFVEFSERLIQAGALQPRLEFGWWVILEEWERAYTTLVNYAGEKKNIDVEFLYARESEGFRSSPFFDDVTRILNLDSYWQVEGVPGLLTAEPVE
jgi:tetratricopeptide (TPR) repeat protein